MSKGNEKCVFVNVDTQIDFMNKDGALYVPGAEDIKPNLSKLTEYALKYRIKIMSTCDCHLKEDKELSRNGGPFPDHCMFNTYGCYRIPETRVPICKGGPYYKRCYDIFDDKLGSEYFDRQLTKWNVKTAVVYGIALDICVRATIIGLLKRGIKTYLVTDATKAVDEEKGKETIKELMDKGLQLTTTEKTITI